MGDIAQRGNRLTFARGGRAGFQDGGSPHTKDKQKSPRKEFITGYGSQGKSRRLAGPVYGQRTRRILSERDPRKFKAPGKPKDSPIDQKRRNQRIQDQFKPKAGQLAEGGRIGLKKGKMPWGTGPKPGTLEFLQQTTQTPKRKRKAVGGIIKGGKKIVKKIIDKIKKKKRHESLDIPGSPGPHIGKYPGIDKAMKNIKKSGDIWGPGKAAGGRIGKAVGGSMDPKHHKPKPKWPPKGWENYKPRQWPQQKPPQLRKSQKERREELRKKARKSGGHSKIVFHDEWKHIDPGLQKGLFKKDGGRAGGSPHTKDKQKSPRKEFITGYGSKGKSRMPAGKKLKFGSMITDTKNPQYLNPFKKGGKADKNWIQKAVNPKHKGYCTPMTKKTCTPARKALARTFKKKAKTGWG